MIDLDTTALDPIIFKIKALTITDTGSTDESGDITITMFNSYTPTITPPTSQATTESMIVNQDGTFLFDKFISSDLNYPATNYQVIDVSHPARVFTSVEDNPATSQKKLTIDTTSLGIISFTI